MYAVLLNSEMRDGPPQSSVERPVQVLVQPVWPVVEGLLSSLEQ